MRCILVFDHLNDILFSKCDKKFIRHIQALSKQQGIEKSDDSEDDENELNINYVIQLFSPLVTSQRIMSSQFGNSYTSIKCEGGTNMVFDEYMGYLFVNIGVEDISWLKRMLGVCIAIVQHLCGPNVSVLKNNTARRVLISRLLDTWNSLVNRDQAVLVEALEQLTVNSDLSSAAIKTLREATDRIKSHLEHPKSHALIFVENKFLALYSSKSAGELQSGDMLLLSLLAECLRPMQTPIIEQPIRPGDSTDSNLSSEEFYSPDSSPEERRKRIGTVNGEMKGSLNSEVILLSGANGTPAVSPHVVHVTTLTEGVSLLLLYQTCNEVLSNGLNEAFTSANAVSTATSSFSGELEGIKRGMESLEVAMKKVFDGLKKIKAPDISPKLEASIKVLHAKWDLLRKQWKDNGDSGYVASVCAYANSLISCLKDILEMTVLDSNPIIKALPAALSISHTVAASLDDFTEFLKVKALRNFTLGSRASLSINKYLEEFPGLVHFLYIDRTSHRITAPCLEFKSQQTIALTKKKIWTMVEFSRSHLQEGHLAVMWKDNTFNYAYYLWFEDNMGAPLKPKVTPSLVVRSLPLPGVMSGDFYQKLIEACFPKTPLGKVRCFELYCIHLGLATSSCVLEHSRRLAATIWEVTGMPNNPLDLL